MRPLHASVLLSVWETGQNQHPLDRALSILGAALPEAPLDELARLPIGRRDALLIELRERTFGPVMDGFVECAKCGERLEVAVAAAALTGTLGATGDAIEQHLVLGEHEVWFRLPTSFDLAAAAGAGSAPAAARAIMAGVVTGATRGGEPVAASELPEAVIAAVGERVIEADPLSDILLAPVCPACGETASVPFDIGAFLWTEIRFHARRLLAEVDRLAHAYGWPEAEILALSPARRRAYLELVAA